MGLTYLKEKSEKWPCPGQSVQFPSETIIIFCEMLSAKDDHKVQLGIATKVVKLVLRNEKWEMREECPQLYNIY